MFRLVKNNTQYSPFRRKIDFDCRSLGLSPLSWEMKLTVTRRACLFFYPVVCAASYCMGFNGFIYLFYFILKRYSVTVLS